MVNKSKQQKITYPKRKISNLPNLVANPNAVPGYKQKNKKIGSSALKSSNTPSKQGNLGKSPKSKAPRPTFKKAVVKSKKIKLGKKIHLSAKKLMGGS